MSSTKYSSPAQRFLAIRTDRGLSQQAFADALGISMRAEQNYERGERRLTAEILLSLAKVYGIDPIWVMDGPGEVPRKLIAGGDVDAAILARALRVVNAAVAESGKRVGDARIAEWVAAIYRFYAENPSGTGPDLLVKSLIGVKQ